MLTTTGVEVKTTGSYRIGWLICLLLTIGSIGFCTGPVYVTLKIIARLDVSGDGWASKIADQVMTRGVALLMWLQPWYAAKTAIFVPNPLERSGRGVLFVSNHRSHLDAFVLLEHLPGIQILAKRSLFFIPFLNLFMWAGRQIPVARGSVTGFLRAMEEVSRRLRLGKMIHVFPELTRCEFGFEGTQNFSLAPFHAAKQGDALVVPIVFKNTDLAWTRSRWGIRRAAGVEARSLPPIVANDFDSAHKLRDEVRRQINEALR